MLDIIFFYSVNFLTGRNNDFSTKVFYTPLKIKDNSPIIFVKFWRFENCQICHDLV